MTQDIDCGIWASENNRNGIVVSDLNEWTKCMKKLNDHSIPFHHSPIFNAIQCSTVHRIEWKMNRYMMFWPKYTKSEQLWWKVTKSCEQHFSLLFVVVFFFSSVCPYVLQIIRNRMKSINYRLLNYYYEEQKQKTYSLVNCILHFIKWNVWGGDQDQINEYDHWTWPVTVHN